MVTAERHERKLQAALARGEGISAAHVYCTGARCTCCEKTAILLVLWGRANGAPVERHQQVARQINLAFMGNAVVSERVQ
jgi:hypothetical protein